MRKIFYGVEIVLLTSLTSHSQESVQYLGNPFGNFSVGARNISLANANIAEAYDISSMYENPATIAFIENSSVFLNHSQGPQTDGMEENLAVPVMLASSIVLGFGANVYNLGYLTKPATTNDKIFEYGYDLAFAGAVTPTLSIGGAASIHHGATASNSQAWGAFYSFGLDYVPSGDVSYSIVYDGLGTDLLYSTTPYSSSLVAASSQMTRSLEVGATMRYPSSESLRSTIFILSFANEKIFGTTGLYYKGGIEIRPLDFLQMRFGYVLGPGVAGARYGFGVQEYFLSVEYAVYPQSSVVFQQISFSVKI
ncbi:MAG: hypothetical protein WAO19_09125 [Candidatus Kryptoniota bacterium]